MNLDQFVPALAMAALILKIIDVLRYARNADWNGVLTQAVTWGAGIIVFLLAAQTAWAHEVVIGSKRLDALGFWSLVFAGLTVASGASLTKDTLKAIDGITTVRIGTLLRPGPRTDATAAAAPIEPEVPRR